MELVEDVLAATGLSARLPARLAKACIAGSRSRNPARIGVAIHKEEYVPVANPIKSASERSFNVPAPNKPAPTNKIEPTGNNATKEVLNDLTIVWLTARFAAFEYVLRPLAAIPFVFSLTLSKTTTVS